MMLRPFWLRSFSSDSSQGNLAMGSTRMCLPTASGRPSLTSSSI